MGLDIFENEGISEKRCIEIEDWGFSVHFGLGLQENSSYTLHYVSTKILQSGGKFRLNNFREAVESPESWNLMGFCPKKNHSVS